LLRCPSQGRGLARTKYDWVTFFSFIEKGHELAKGKRQVMKCFSDYVDHYTALSEPFTLTALQVDDAAKI
jgi:hypothetical protein